MRNEFYYLWDLINLFRSRLTHSSLGYLLVYLLQPESFFLVESLQSLVHAVVEEVVFNQLVKLVEIQAVYH